MENNQIQSALNSIILLGTDNQSLNISDFPLQLQPILSQVLQNAPSKEVALFQIFNIVSAFNCAVERPFVPSFSVQQMALIHKINQQSGSVSQSGDTVSQSSEGDLPSTESSDETQEQRKSEQIALSQSEIALHAQYQMHTGPKPLPEVTLEDKFLPLDVCSLLIGFGEKKSPLMYWFLRKMGSCPLVVDGDFVEPLVKIFLNLNWAEMRLGFNRDVFTNFTLQHFLFKVGGQQLRYILPYLQSSMSKSSILLRDKVFDENGQINVKTLFEHGSNSEILGAFIEQRWLDPKQAASLYDEHSKKAPLALRKDLLEHFEINLSSDDEPILMQLLQKERSSECREVIQYLLGKIPNSQYSKLCAEEFKLHVNFDNPEQWTFSQFSYNDRLKALGFVDPKLKEPSDVYSRGVLKDLLYGMSLSDILALTGKTDRVEALQSLLKLNTKQYKKKDRFFIGNDPSLLHLLPNKFTAQDSDLIEAFLDEVNKIRGDLIPDNCLDLLYLLPLQSRLERLPKIATRILFSPYWFTPVENKAAPIDLHVLDESWSQAILDFAFERMDYSVNVALLHDCIMFMPYSICSWLETRLEQFNKESEELQKKIEEQHRSLMVFKWRDKLRNLTVCITFIQRLITELKLKQQAEVVLQQSLPEYFVDDLATVRRCQHEPKVNLGSYCFEA